jgi:hypothetical protein
MRTNGVVNYGGYYFVGGVADAYSCVVYRSEVLFITYILQ